MNENIYNKLVRDRIPELLRFRGVHCTTKQAEGSEYMDALNRKLQGSIAKYLFSKEGKHQLENLADVLEIIRAIIAEKGVDTHELEEIRQSLLEEKGGFENHLILEKTTRETANEVSLPKCIFCRIGNERNDREIVEAFPHCYAIYDAQPVTRGHILIIPYKHISSWFEADKEICIDIIQALEALKVRLDYEFQPDGYNIGISCGEPAGQTVSHLHVHLIPRYKGDTDHPHGGIRRIIPHVST